jgi:hypothetical protein
VASNDPQGYQWATTSLGSGKLFGFETIDMPVEGCTLCPANNRLPFQPFVAKTNGYVIPDSRHVRVHIPRESGLHNRLVPTPFCVRVVPFNHIQREGNSFDLNFDDNWMCQIRELLAVIPGLEPGDPWSLHGQFGYPEGTRNQGWEHLATQRGAPHAFMHIVYGRGKLSEAGVERRHPMYTAGLGLNAILHQSRDMPNDQTLWEIWQQVKDRQNAYLDYNKAVLELLA